MEIDSETTAGRLQLQDLIFKKTLEETKNILRGLYCRKDYINTMKQQHQQQHGGKTRNKTKNVKGNNFQAKNVKPRSTSRTSGGWKGKGRYSDKNTKYQSYRKSGGRGRGKVPPKVRNNASRGGIRNRGRIPSRDYSQRSEQTLQTWRGGQRHQYWTGLKQHMDLLYITEKPNDTTQHYI